MERLTFVKLIINGSHFQLSKLCVVKRMVFKPLFGLMRCCYFLLPSVLRKMILINPRCKGKKTDLLFLSRLFGTKSFSCQHQRVSLNGVSIMRVCFRKNLLAGTKGIRPLHNCVT